MHEFKFSIFILILTLPKDKNCEKNCTYIKENSNIFVEYY